MKRFHVHMHVDDLPKNIAFYSAMFNQPPARTEADYAKWMLQDPPVNFAISTRGTHAGIDHLGIQTDDPAELAAMKATCRSGGHGLARRR
jgi:catechol 2,3-dioxygenase-like lactoylglutathione lyase family enzyme